MRAEPKVTTWRLQNYPTLDIFLFRAPDNLQITLVLPGSGVLLSELQTKLEKYETKAAHCEEAAQKAPGARERAMYEELFRYYNELATDFRNVIGKQRAT